MKLTSLPAFFVVATFGFSWCQQITCLPIESGAMSYLESPKYHSGLSRSVSSRFVDAGAAIENFNSKTPILKNGEFYRKYVFNDPAQEKIRPTSNLSQQYQNIAPKKAQQEDTSTYKIYPNPVKDRIFFDDDKKSKNLDVIIYDVLGKVVKKDRLTALTIRNGIEVSDLKRGVYLVQIDSGGNSFTQKLIKN